MKHRRELLLCSALALALVAVVVLFVKYAAERSDAPETITPSRIAVLQVRPQEWADALKLGFIDGLGELGLEVGRDVVIVPRSAAGDPQGLTSLAQALERQDFAMVYALGTQASQEAFRSIKSKPIIFGAVTDPVQAGFYDGSFDRPRGDITGTQDVWPYPAQFDLMQEVVPNLTRLGIVYNSSEINSQVSVRIIRGECADRGIELVERTVTEEAQVSAAVAGLLNAGIDALFIPADNTAQTSANVIIAASMREQVPVFTGISGIVENGALGTVGTNYYQLGRVNARQAAEILAGKAAKDIPVLVAEEGDLYLNLASATKLGITIPDDLLESAVRVYE